MGEWKILWINQHDGGPHEAKYLKLECSKLKSTFGWSPRWNLEKAVEKVVEWSKVWWSGQGCTADYGPTNRRVYS